MQVNSDTHRPFGSSDNFAVNPQTQYPPIQNPQTTFRNQNQNPQVQSPVFHIQPSSSQTNNYHVFLNYQISPVKAVTFTILALLPIIGIGVLMGTCPTKYQDGQICQSGYSFYSYYYYDYYYGTSSLSQSQCCDPLKIVFGIWLGTFLAYLLVNILVHFIRPPSMSDFFIVILLYSRVGQGTLCCPNSCHAIFVFLFWPIISVIAVVAGIIYLIQLCIQKTRAR